MWAECSAQIRDKRYLDNSSGNGSMHRDKSDSWIKLNRLLAVWPYLAVLLQQFVHTASLRSGPGRLWIEL